MPDYVAAQYVVLVAFQAIFWRWVLDGDAPVVRTAAAWIRRRPARLRAVLANAEPHFKAYGVAATDTEVLLRLWFAMNFFAPLHHALGAGCALMAVRNSSASWHRLAISFEVGEDVLHYAQMAWTYRHPERGSVPWKYCDATAWAFVAVHHLIGLCAGSGAFLTDVANWVEVMRFVALLLVAGVPSMLKLPFELLQDLGPPSAAGKLAALLEVFSLLFLATIRLVLYVPAVLALLERAWLPLGTTATYLYGAVLLVVGTTFNLASVVLYAPTVLNRVRGQFLAPPATKKAQ